MSEWRAAVVRECLDCGAKVTWAKPSTTGCGYYADFDLHEPYRRHLCPAMAALDSTDPESVREYLNAAIEASAWAAIRERATPGLSPARIAELARQRAQSAQSQEKATPRPPANVTPLRPVKPDYRDVDV